MKKFQYAPLLLCLMVGATALPSLSEEPLSRLIHLSREKGLAHDPYWKKLLHYRKTFWGTEKSEIDGKNFFLSPLGRTDPQAELEATLRAFMNPIPNSLEEQKPQCRYPERYHWLQEKLNFSSSEIPPATCERFEAWKSKLDPEGVSLVFASYYMNNPASMYGHTFLRLHRWGKEVGNHLLDYTVNFSANTNTNNGIIFALMGLTGGFRGVFSTDPYYMKIQKYNNLESRDLWDYELDLNPAAVERLVRHLWELGPTTMAYYFFNKNCSYQLLPLLDVARPDLNLSSRFGIRAIPLDTLRTVIREPGLLKQTSYRPSHLRRMQASRDNLTPKEILVELNWISRPLFSPLEEIRHISPERQPHMLDAAYDLLRYKKGFHREQTEDTNKIEQKLLSARSSYPPPSNIILNKPDAPQEAHGTGRWNVGFGSTRENTYQELGIRGALHDIEADPTGYVDGSQLEMLHARIRYANGIKKLYLHEGTLVQVKSLAPWEEWIHRPSWGIKIGFESARDLRRQPQDSLYFGTSGQTGITWRLAFLPRTLWYNMAESDVGVGGIFRRNYRWGIGASTGLVFIPTSRWRFHLSGSYLRYGAGEVGSVNKIRFVPAYSINKSNEIRILAERLNHHTEATCMLNRYF